MSADVKIRILSEDQTKKGLTDAEKQLKKVEMAINAVGLATVFAAKKTLQFVYESTKLAARVETLGVVTQTLGKTAGYTTSEIAKLERAIQDQGITTQASRQSLALMMQAQLDLADATNLARLAQDAAVIAGTNSSEAFQRLINVITTGNVRMARTMGLQVDFNAGYQEMAEQLGKTTDELTAQELAQSRSNSVMAQGAQIAGAYEDAMDSVGKQLDSTARYLEEWKLSIGKVNVEILGEGNRAFQSWLANQTEMNDAVYATIEATKLGILSEDEAFAIRYELSRGTKDYAEVLAWLISLTDGYVPPVTAAYLANDRLHSSIAGLNEVQGITIKQYDNATKALDGFSKASLGAAAINKLLEDVMDR